MRICICATQIPFSRGGAENLVQSLQRQLVRRGYEAEVVTVPFSWHPRLQVVKSAFAWRLLDLTTLGGEPIDLVIATRFPSYLIPHPNKVVWLIHQFRQVYDLLGTRYSDFTSSPEDRAVVRTVRAMDTRSLGEARALYSISANTAQRVRRFHRLECEPLYPPPDLDDALHCGPFGDYVLAVGRLDELKRVHLLVDAMARVRSAVRCKIAGSGPQAEALAERIAKLGLEGRVELLGRVEDEALVELYANALCVFYAPFDEDYGYVTVEAFRAGKPVLTASDSGGVLELVEDGKNGFVTSSGAVGEFAARIDQLFEDRERAAKLGQAGRESVREIAWTRVIDTLTRYAA